MKRAGLLRLVLAWVRPVSLYSVVLSTVKKPVVDTGSESLSLLKFQAELPLNLFVVASLFFIQFLKSNNLKNRGKMR